MNKNTKIIIAVLGVVIVAGGALLVFSKNNDNQATQAPQNSNSNNSASETAEQEADVTITYTSSGFELSATTVKAGGTVKVLNNSTKDLEFESDPHPAHTDNSEFNAGKIAPGKSVIFTLTTTGKWGFHNHLNARHNGELTVE